MGREAVMMPSTLLGRMTTPQPQEAAASVAHDARLHVAASNAHSAAQSRRHLHQASAAAAAAAVPDVHCRCSLPSTISSMATLTSAAAAQRGGLQQHPGGHGGAVAWAMLELAVQGALKKGDDFIKSGLNFKWHKY
jgi:hypothetical protein